MVYEVLLVVARRGWRQKARCSSVWLVSVSRTERVRGSHWLQFRTLDAAHCSMKLGGKVREAVERAETQEHVRCAAGSCVSSAMSMGTTLGGGAVTLGGGMATLGGGSTTLGVGTDRVGRGGRGGGDGPDWKHGWRCHGWIGDTVGEDVAEI